MAARGLKRFYKNAAVSVSGSGFAVTLDGKPIRTPVGAALKVPTRALAQAIAGEWDAQKELILPPNMPLTGLANAAIDRAGPDAQRIIEEMLRFAASDLLCYRAESPADLVERQAACWQPVLDWLAETYGARLKVFSGVVPMTQSAAALAALRAAMEDLTDLELTALATATGAAGSLVVGLALIAGRLTVEEAIQVSQLDETFQADLWGRDDEAEDRRRRIGVDIHAAAEFLRLAETG